MTEKEKKRALDRAAKLKPKPVLLPSGSWHCGVMVAGERYSVTAPTPEEAHARAIAIKEGLMQKHRDPARITVGEAIDRYIESKDAVLSPSTISGYKKLRRVMLPSIMNENAAVIDTETVQRAVNAMAREKSPKYVANVYGLFTAAMGEYFPERVFRVKLPQKPQKELNIPSMEDINILAADAKGTRFELPFLLALWLGLRTSEIRGLTWDCIDGDMLHVKQAVVDGEHGPVLKGTKTYSGDRYIKIPEYIMGLLERQPRRDEYVVHYSRCALYNHLNRMCKRCGVQHYRFHDLRHVQASVLLLNNVPDKYAMERMGHSSSYMLKRYQHTFDGKRREVSDTVDDYFRANLHTVYTQEIGERDDI